MELVFFFGMYPTILRDKVTGFEVTKQRNQGFALIIAITMFFRRCVGVNLNRAPTPIRVMYHLAHSAVDHLNQLLVLVRVPAHKRFRTIVSDAQTGSPAMGGTVCTNDVRSFLGRPPRRA